MTDQHSGNMPEATLREHGSGQKLFGRYTLIKILGRGGMGVVWLARDEELEREVALKFLPDLIIHDRTLLNELKRETKRSLELTHKNIVRIYDFVHDERSGCISMEYINGDTLSNLRAQKERKVFEPNEIGPWTSQLCDALDYAHNHAKIIHRDLKPTNLMVNQRGDLKVSDFGIARSLGDTVSRLTMEQGRSGTLVYMSPQQLDGERTTHLDDIYSLGATLYDLLTSKPPFYSGNIDRQIHERSAPSMTERRKDLNIEPALVPQVWEDAVAACLAKDPTQRPQSAAEVAQRLQLSSPQTPAVPSVLIKRPKKKLVFAAAVAVVCVLAVAGSYFGLLKRHGKPVAHPDQASPSQNSAVAIPAKSIAVLPFENLSEEKANAYFAEGIQEEILTRLAKITDLKVISRTSTAKYRSAPDNLREIAKQLGVANILEGSVQKTADQVRVNVQLINAQTDSHLWADTYDRKLTDIFGVESEIAKAIADSLQAKLTGREEQALTVKPTNNPEAYDAYLRGLAFEARSTGFQDDLVEKAIASYERAVELDPNFALAWSRLSRAHDSFYVDADTNATRRDAAKRALDKAQKLQPDSPDTLLALGDYQFYVLGDYGLAKVTFQRVNKMLPGNIEALTGLAYIARREGHWDESIAYAEQALVLDPHNTDSLQNTAAETYVNLRQFPAALKLYDRALDLLPNDPDLMAAKAVIYQAEGNLEEAAKFLPDINAQTPSSVACEAKITQLVFERNFVEAVRLQQARLTQSQFRSESGKAFAQVALAFNQRLAGDSAGAKGSAEEARNTLEPLCKSQPDNAFYAAALAQAYAVLGDKNSALKEAERATTLVPSAKEPLWGPSFEENLALIELILGEKSRVIPTLARLLQTPYHEWAYGTPITPAHLRLDPTWDPLRGDPAFQKLCEEKAR